MAGIGFELRRILQQETFSAAARAYALGALVALGPFLCSVGCLLALSLLSVGLTDLENWRIFTGAVVYAFGGALVTTGLIQVVVTRYLADQVYRGELEGLSRSLFPVLLTTSLLMTASAIPVLVSIELSTLARVTLFTLYLTIGGLFLAAVFLTSAQGHTALGIIFLIGSAVSLGAGWLGLRRFGLDGLLLGYTAGQFLLLILLVDRLTRELGFPDRWDWGFLRYVKLYPALVLVGLFSNLGVWIDKFIFWGSELSVETAGIVTAPKYDSATFLGFLTAQPAIVHFFVKIEAEFAEDFHRYYDEVFFRSSLDRVQEAAAGLRRAVRAALTEILAIQLVLTFLAAFFAEEILRGLGLPVSQIGMFRAGVLSSFFLAFMLFSNVILLYLDRQREVLVATGVFLFANVSFTLLSLRLGYGSYGFGFAAACLLGMLVSLGQLARQLAHLELMTFATIPIAGQRRARAGLRARPGGQFGRYHPLP